jgi:hypothetical protein
MVSVNAKFDVVMPRQRLAVQLQCSICLISTAHTADILRRTGVDWSAH